MEKESRKSRKISSTVLGLLIVFSVLSVMNFASMNARAAFDETITWDVDTYIKTDTTYPSTGKNSTQIILDEADLYICDGVTLTFNDNVSLEIKNSAGVAGDYGIQINATAKFVVNSGISNTTIKTHTDTPTRTYSFTNSGTIDFLGATVQRVYGNPDTDVMGGIVNEPGSVCELENCKLYDADP